MRDEMQKLTAIKDNHEFGRALRDFVFKQGLNQSYMAEMETFPPIVDAVLQLSIFDTNILISGMWKFILEYGPHFKKLEQACRLIGASKALAYLQAVKECFPDHTIPENANARGILCDQFERELRRIDKVFSGASSEALGCLREFIVFDTSEFMRQVSGFWFKYKAVGS